MGNVVAIKKYFLTDDNIVIKYKKGKAEKQILNKSNLAKLIKQLNNQYPFDTESIMKKQDSMYSSVAYITFLVTLIEGIIFLNLLIAFEVGIMKTFIICSILSTCCIGLHFLYLFISFIILKKLKKKYKICRGKDFVLYKYEQLYGDLADNLVDESINDVEIKEENNVKNIVKDLYNIEEEPNFDIEKIELPIISALEKVSIEVVDDTKDVNTVDISSVNEMEDKHVSTKEKKLEDIEVIEVKEVSKTKDSEEKIKVEENNSISKKAEDTKELVKDSQIEKKGTKSSKKKISEEEKEQQKKQARKKKAKSRKRKTKNSGSKPKKKTNKKK